MKGGRSLKAKLGISFTVLCIIIFLQGLLSVVSGYLVSAQNERLFVFEQSTQEISTVASNHYEWVANLTLAVYTGDEFRGSLDSTQCSLGQWLVSDYVQTQSDPELSVLLDAVRKTHNAMHEDAALLMGRYQAGTITQEEIEQTFLEVIKPNSLETIGYLEQMVEVERNKALEAEANIVSLLQTSRIISVAAIVVCIVIAILLTQVLTKKIVPPIEKLTLAAEKLAQGKTDADVAVDSNDEIGTLSRAFSNMQQTMEEQAQLVETVAGGDLTRKITPRGPEDHMGIALNKMTKNLNDMFLEIQIASGQVSGGAGQIADGSQSLAQGTTEQASAIAELSMSVSQVSRETQGNAEIAAKAARLVEEISASAEVSAHQMEDLLQAVQDINKASSAISQVIKAIDDIAFQTNILALNAAVEAARAGSHGKGFAVVANEVRDLSAKSAEAAKDTTKLIKDSIGKAEQGASMASATHENLKKMVISIVESSQIMDEIARSSLTQNEEIGRIHEGIDQVTRVVHQNSATSEEAAAAAEELSAQARLLNNLMSQFRLTGQPVIQLSPPPVDLSQHTGFALADGKY